ncbi:helix-turn-helix transcriptional regulator [Flavivirga algicola]|uniref:HTH luxR-type domain-containing protein n=1 Tax=Flavivirga algicola TaxID=2729136 RepID=A0ABX1RXT4_9FLAO|nr:hypothetical protein [Flavivirga algicola]NMH88410.1 hypothetical protein [Flavivirga algicola]
METITNTINGQIESLINSKILTQQDWRNFKNQFTKLYPKFFITLKIKGLHLTNSEERLLALEFLNLNTFEIADKLGISNRSVIVSRHRLRKKTGAPKGLPILEFLDKK